VSAGTCHSTLPTLACCHHHCRFCRCSMQEEEEEVMNLQLPDSLLDSLQRLRAKQVQHLRHIRGRECLAHVLHVLPRNMEIWQQTRKHGCPRLQDHPHVTAHSVVVASRIPAVHRLARACSPVQPEQTLQRILLG